MLEPSFSDVAFFHRIIITVVGHRVVHGLVQFKHSHLDGCECVTIAQVLIEVEPYLARVGSNITVCRFILECLFLWHLVILQHVELSHELTCDIGASLRIFYPAEIAIVVTCIDGIGKN